MADIVSQRETLIVLADRDGLYPKNFLYPSDDLFPKDGGFMTISNIVAGSLKLNEYICEKIPQFGQLFATKFECKVYLTTDVSGKYIRVYQMDGGIYHDVFSGIVDSCKLDKLGTDRAIVAYDIGYTKGQINVGPWWTEFWSNRETSTLKACRESMLEYYEVYFEDVTLPNDDLEITKTVDITTCTLSTMLRMMCEINYCFPHFNRYSELEYIMLNTDPQTTKDLTGKYEWSKSTFEDFVTSEIKGVQFYDSGNQLKWTVGETSNAYPIKKNIFLYDKGTTVLNQIGNDILSYLSDLSYMPAKIKMIVGDFDLKLGDYVHTEKGDFYVLRNTYSGSQFYEQTIEARGQEFLYEGTPHIDYGELVLNEKIARVNFTIEEFKIEYADFKEQTHSQFIITDQKIETEVSRAQTAEQNLNGTITTVNETLSSRITQTAESISTEVTRATTAETNLGNSISTVNTNLSSRITQTAESISTEVTRAQTAETNLGDSISTVNTTLSSRITQTAESITSEVSRATTAEGSLSNSIDNVNTTLSSRISQTAESITAEVSRASAAEGTLSSRISQNATAITTKVTNGTVSSSISQEAGAITISSNRLSISSTNFTLGTDGTITATNANLSGQLTAGSDSSETGNKIVINDGVITGYTHGIEQARLEVTNGAFNIASGVLQIQGFEGVSGDTGFVKGLSYEEYQIGTVTYENVTGCTGVTINGTGSVSGSTYITIPGYTLNVYGSITIDGQTQTVTMTGQTNAVQVQASFSSMQLYGLSATPTNGPVGTSQVFHPTIGINGITGIKAISANTGAITSKYGIIQAIS